MFAQIFAGAGVLALLAAPMRPAAAIIPASPSSVDTAIAAGKPGDTVVLAVGAYPRIDVRSCLAAPGATLDASAATIGWLYMPGACGWVVKGGEFAHAAFDAIQIANGSRLSLVGGYVHDWGTSGLAIGASSDITVTGMIFAHAGNDAIDVVGSNRVTISGNHGFDINYGTAHADFIQAWGGGDGLTITDNDVMCHCQGFDNYGDAQPMTHVTITGNRVATDTTTGAKFTNVTGVMSGNFGATLSTMPKGWGGVQWVMTAPVGQSVTLGVNVNGVAP